MSSDQMQGTKDTVAQKAEQTKNFGEEKAGQAKDGTQAMAQGTKDKTNEAGKTTKEKTIDGKNSSGGVMQQAGDKAKETFANAKEAMTGGKK
ncbi:protein MpLEA-like52 [Marchantia polymorpha subsp. ruderalis]|uniref:Uncharacterized protein n=2 Tax=Marchantia polymorpha TaxID=3197 RepID=A0A176VL41_MARPO|nr:hypothetical protein AXG93_4698s1370 [Marchantia polymorpha subsp. ruderalis]PTQ37063.1 hypothetical protein MARPO_0059s0015 [Marchantia polymorpha]BBN14656.1 hypothetical protein Mp_6g13350 [Marchantia polymorpha subsp. ruderalis]|eukprot:PTQ37063.1 hypothetical protein MARPO_0059s0015 [Marchantia polymorpha]